MQGWRPRGRRSGDRQRDQLLRHGAAGRLAGNPHRHRQLHPGARGTLEIDVNGTTQGTQFDHLAVGGAANLDGAVAVVKGAGFDPLLTDTFPFLTSASRTGTFDTLAGSLLASGKGYQSRLPRPPDSAPG